MIAVDTNLLVYAHRRESRAHTSPQRSCRSAGNPRPRPARVAASIRLTRRGAPRFRAARRLDSPGLG